MRGAPGSAPRPRGAWLGLGAGLVLAAAAGAQGLGITLPPYGLGVGPGAAVEGEAPFQELARDLAQAVDHPVEVRLFTHRDELTDELRRGGVAFAVLDCMALAGLPEEERQGSRVLAAMTLAGRSEYRGILLTRTVEPPREARRRVAVPSRDSLVASAPLARRNRRSPWPARGGLEALERLVDGEVEAALVPDLTLEEARAQGFPADDLVEEARTDPVPFEAFLVSSRVAARFDGRLRALLLKAKVRSPRKVMVGWRLLDRAAYQRECAW